MKGWKKMYSGWPEAVCVVTPSWLTVVVKVVRGSHWRASSVPRVPLAKAREGRLREQETGIPTTSSRSMGTRSDSSGGMVSKSRWTGRPAAQAGTAKMGRPCRRAYW
jgi:hypothetical protein